MENVTKRTRPVREHINNQALMDSMPDVKIVHLHLDNLGRPFKKPMTVAWRQKHNNAIEVATAVVHNFDCFEKKVGTKIALEKMQKGSTSIFPFIPSRKDRITNSAFVKRAFRFLIEELNSSSPY